MSNSDQKGEHVIVWRKNVHSLVRSMCSLRNFESNEQWIEEGTIVHWIKCIWIIELFCTCSESHIFRSGMVRTKDGTYMDSGTQQFISVPFTWLGSTASAKMLIERAFNIRNWEINDKVEYYCFEISFLLLIFALFDLTEVKEEEFNCCSYSEFCKVLDNP